MKSSSIIIQNEINKLGGKELGRSADCILWQIGDGRKVIETNGDPVWEDEDGFDEIAQEIN